MLTRAHMGSEPAKRPASLRSSSLAPKRGSNDWHIASVVAARRYDPKLSVNPEVTGHGWTDPIDPDDIKS